MAYSEVPYRHLAGVSTACRRKVSEGKLVPGRHLSQGPLWSTILIALFVYRRLTFTLKMEADVLPTHSCAYEITHCRKIKEYGVQLVLALKLRVVFTCD